MLGVGGTALSPIPKFDPEGHLLGVWEADEVLQTDTYSAGRTIGGSRQTLVEADGRPVQAFQGSGTEHLSSLKEPHLQALARAGGPELSGAWPRRWTLPRPCATHAWRAARWWRATCGSCRPRRRFCCLWLLRFPGAAKWARGGWAGRHNMRQEVNR